MRTLILSLTLICCTHIGAQSVGQRITSALENIGQGYIQYGFNELKAAANTNALTAQYYMAVCYEKGIAIEPNLTEAFRWYRRAAERGLPDAMYQLAYFYKNGIVVAKNESRSNEWLERYNDKGGMFTLPDINSYYNEGLKHPENYAMNPNGGGNNGKTLANNGGNDTSNRQVVNHITVVQNSSTTPSIQNGQKQEEKSSALQSDVDRNIPVNPQKNENAFALIIANENYQTVAKVPNALNDGEVFAEYCKKTLGLPETNIHLVKDATLNNIKREINWIKQITEVYEGAAKLIVYYAGHGIPDEKTSHAYLLPVDGYTADMTTCYSLIELYGALGKMASSQIVVLLDACFSGSLRGDGMLASARGVAIKAKSSVPTGQMIVLSASQGDETAYPMNDEGHGLFTYYLLKRLQETQGNVSLGELASFVTDNVKKKSLVVNGKLQTPTVSPSAQATDWRNWKLK